MTKRRAPAWRFAMLLMAMSLGAGACAPLFGEAGNPALPAADAAPGESDYESGKRHLAEGRFGLAVLHFRAALAETPDSIAALNGLGVTFDRMGRFDLATRAYGRALVLEPHDGQTLNNLGYSYLLQGRYGLAVAYLRRASVTLEASPRILANRRLAEQARFRAGGPRAPGDAPGGAASAVSSAPGTPFTPHMVRAGKGLRHLVTQPPAQGEDPPKVPRAGAGPRPDPPARPQRPLELLPGFLAAPMALGRSPAGGRAIGLKPPP